MTVRIIPILAAAIVIGPSLAHGSPACMTKSEARAKFPNEVLYSHQSCWDNSAANAAAPVDLPRQPSGAAMPASPPPVLAAEPVPSPRPEPEIVNSDIGAGARCHISPCE